MHRQALRSISPCIEGLRPVLHGVSSALALANSLIRKHTYHFTFRHSKVEIHFWFLFQRKEILLLWKVAKLGESYPGGYYSLLDPTLEFVHQETYKIVRLPLLLMTSHTHRARMTGKKGYYRVRGLRLPKIPFSVHIGLKKGGYEVRLKFGLQDVEGLNRYTPAYSENTTEFEISLGFITLKKDMLESENHPINELHYEVVDHKKIQKQALPPVVSGAEGAMVPWRYLAPNMIADHSFPTIVSLPKSTIRNPKSDDLNPEHYFEKHLIIPAQKINQLGYKAFYPACANNKKALQNGAFGATGGERFLQGQRIFGEYCGSLALAYRLTGKPEYYHASHIAYEILERNIWKTQWGWAWGIETFREGENLLELGLCAQGVYEFYKITGDKRLLHRVHKVLDSWPYNKKHHIPFIEVHRDGKEIHPSYPFNMVAVGCAAMWFIAMAVKDKALQQKVKDTLHHFLLPMMEEDGHWRYAFHYEEEEKRPEPAGYHYDMFTKRNLARLLEFPEWRDDSKFMEAMIKGAEFNLTACAVEKGNMLIWSDQYTEQKGPQFSINHAGLMVALLALMVKYVDKKYLKPLEQTVRFLYHERDRKDLPHSVDWKSGWIHSHTLVPLFNVREYGFRVVGESVKRLQVELEAEAG